MTNLYSKHKPFITLLAESHPVQQQALLNSAPHEQIRFLCNCMESFTCPEEVVNKLRPFNQDLADLIDKNEALEQKE